MGIFSALNPLRWKEKAAEYRRVLDISRKPDGAEYLRVAKITTYGIAVVGAVGFIVYILYQLTLGGLV